MKKLGEVFDSMNKDEDLNINFNNASSDDNMDGAGQLEVMRTEG